LQPGGDRVKGFFTKGLENEWGDLPLFVGEILSTPGDVYQTNRIANSMKCCKVALRFPTYVLRQST
jgi:hypothetical protein